MPRQAVPPIDRILRRLDPARTDEECWIWPGGLQGRGYGHINSPGGQLLVHRVVYEALVGPIPDGAHVDHTCHNKDTTCPGGTGCPHRACCNPRHLDATTTGENRSRADEPRQRGAFATHCANGHLWSENESWANLGARGGKGQGRRRYCKACNRINVRRQKEKRRARQQQE